MYVYLFPIISININNLSENLILFIILALPEEINGSIE